MSDNLLKALQAMADASKGTNETVDSCLTSSRMQHIAASATKYTIYNRVSLNDYSTDDQRIIVSDGNEDAYKILNTLMNMGCKGDNFLDAMWGSTTILLCLDDMNIRGAQIFDALEYANGSVETLYNILKGPRSQQMCDYINSKSAQNVKKDCTLRFPLVVTGGASSTDRFMLFSSEKVDTEITLLNYETFIKDVPTYDPDNQSDDSSNNIRVALDFIDGETNLKDAIAIFKKYGFIEAARKDISYRTGKLDSGNKHYDVILWNVNTGDFVHMDNTSDKTIGWGRVYITTIRDNSLMSSDKLFDGDRGPVEGTDYYYHRISSSEEESIITTYKKIPDGDIHSIDWSKIGYSTYGIPTHKYVRTKDSDFVRAATMLKSWRFRKAIGDDMCSYYLDMLINYGITYFDLMHFSCPMYDHYQNWFIEGVYNDLAYQSYFEQLAFLFRIMFRYLNREDSEWVANVKSGIRELILKEDDGSKEARAFDSVFMLDIDSDIDMLIKECNFPSLDDLGISV